MEHDIFYERQRALIERSLQAQREEEEARRSIRDYMREKAGRAAYFRLQNTRRGKLFNMGKGHRSPKRVNATVSKCEPMVMQTRRFPGSYITVYCKHRPC